MTDTTDMPGNGPGDDGDGRAAEYVLGTLSLAERLAFEAELAGDPALRRAVAAWSARLQPLADSVAPVAPPTELRARVLAQIAPAPAAGQRPFSLGRWLAWTFGLSALAGAVAVALVFLTTPQPPEAAGFAMLHRATASNDVIAFQIDKKRQDMVVLASAAAPGPGRDYELWVLPPNKPPISLGIVKAGLREERPLPAAAAPYITDFANLAISVEPSGGSPSGAPTGPVLFTGLFRMMDQLTE
ncbi:MAG TPA: anti-sigma factor [Dongiaceae bacterium]|jgi:anti-sigma-K factor RskA|nr:anti-sigma factor [Dongiaceae bacterium]